MNQFANIQLFYLILNTIAVFAVTFLNLAMVITSRRKNLTVFLPWLIPSTLASIATVGAGLIRTFGMVFGFQLSMFWFLFEYGLGIIAIILALISVWRLWQMVNAFAEQSA